MNTIINEILDSDNELFNRAKNSADQVSISVPRLDQKIAEVKIGRRFEILRGGTDTDDLECTGYVSERGYSDEMFNISGFTEEIVLQR
ncbi:MAG: hypothetical protein LC687_03770, partial [Actinobacteria bacterium]|nr:hypothetical protein [Actinomycetota bacterium]